LRYQSEILQKEQINEHIYSTSEKIMHDESLVRLFKEKCESYLK